MKSAYLGPVALGATLRLAHQCTDGDLEIATPDAAPTWASYGTADTSVQTGSLSSSDIDSKTGFRTGNLVASEANGYAAGQLYTVRVAYAVSTNNFADTYTFNVV